MKGCLWTFLRFYLLILLLRVKFLSEITKIPVLDGEAN